MTPERFRAIVDAYGADPRHWPAEERSAARVWSDRHRADADAMLATAGELDALLTTDTITPPESRLMHRIIATAPGPRLFERRGGLWWPGLAFAGAGLAGGLAGALAVSFVVAIGSPPALRAQPYVTTSFGDSSIDWGTK